MGRHAEALPLAERALAISETTLGPDHPDTAVRRNNLKAIHTWLEHEREAEP
ncbi:tetratricopeptide repeat protein [Streptomyces sp. NPDC001288]